MIAAALDPCGSARAEDRVLRAFRSDGLEPAAIQTSGACAVGWGRTALERGWTVEGLTAALHGPPGATWEPTIDGDARLEHACCVVASDSRRLLLARGPYGGRSLFYTSSGAGKAFVACSRLSPLLAALDGDRALDLDRLAAIVSNDLDGDPSRTPYIGVSRTLPCETVVATARGTTRAARPPEVPEIRPRDVRSAAAEMREWILKISGRAARPFDRVAILAGGGLDSSGLLAALVTRAKQEGRPSVDPCTLDFGGLGDDRPHMAALARRLGVQPNRVRPAEVASVLRGLMVVDGAPNAWPATALIMLATIRARERGNQVILMGQGGDDVLDGDLGTFADRALRGQFLRALIDCARLRTSWSSTASERVYELLLRRLVSKGVPDALRFRWRRRRTARELGASWLGPRARDVVLNPRKIRDHSNPWEALATSVNLLDVADVRGQCEVASGLPRLDPYLDGDFVRFVASLPPELLFHGHRMRGLYREATIGLLPSSLRMRMDKASFAAATFELLPEVENQTWFKNLVRMEALGDLRLVEPRLFEQAFARVRSGVGGRGWLEVWPALAVEAFVRGDGSSSSCGVS